MLFPQEVEAEPGYKDKNVMTYRGKGNEAYVCK